MARPDKPGDDELRGKLSLVLLRGLPERFHLVERRAGRGAALGGQLLLKKPEAADEFLVRPGKRFLRIDLQVPGKIGNHEQKVTDLVFDLGMVRAGGLRLDNLVRFFDHLFEDTIGRFPIESNG